MPGIQRHLTGYGFESHIHACKSHDQLPPVDRFSHALITLKKKEM